MKILIQKLLKQKLNEAYSAVDEITELTTDVISHFAVRNFQIFNKCIKAGSIDENTIAFNYNSLDLSSNIIDISKYQILQNFINNGSIRFFFGRIKTNGIYDNGIISINTYTNKFVDALDYQLQHLKRSSTGKVSRKDAILALTIALDTCFRVSISHEIRHAYDDFISAGKYDTDKKSLAFYNTADVDPSKDNYKLKEKQYQVYLTLPHEYWARFTATASTLNKEQPFKSYFNEFKSKIGGWDLLNQNHKQRLSKAVYSYWNI